MAILKRRKRRGNCYACTEALFFLLGGKKKGWTPYVVRHEGDTHWYLVRHFKQGEINNYAPINLVLDPTIKQFKKPPPYHKGRGCGFLTKGPSKKAKALMKQMLWQEV